MAAQLGFAQVLQNFWSQDFWIDETKVEMLWSQHISMYSLYQLSNQHPDGQVKIWAPRDLGTLQSLSRPLAPLKTKVYKSQTWGHPSDRNLDPNYVMKQDNDPKAAANLQQIGSQAVQTKSKLEGDDFPSCPIPIQRKMTPVHIQTGSSSCTTPICFFI